METVALSSSDRPLSRRARVKARVTNHVDLLPNIDGNSPGARRFRDLVNGYISDLGGIELCSQTQIGLLRQLAAINVIADGVAARAVNGGEVNISEMCTLASTVMRLSMRLGFARVSKPVPSLEEHLRYLVEHPTPLPPQEDVETEDRSQDHD